jgi:hypothetical protein
VIGLGIGLRYLIAFDPLGWYHNWELFLVFGLPPLLIGGGGISFLYARRESLDTTNEPIWAVLTMYATLGAYVLWYVYDLTFGYG